jgi:nicotinic acid mononucleotide adenylyltransferase
MLINIEVPDKNDNTKTIVLVRYAIDRREDPTAVLFGCFSPFTGPRGHGRMLRFAFENNIKKFAIVMPTKDDSKDTDRNMFTQEQRLEIAKIGAKECGFDVDVFNVETTNPLGMFREIASKIARPVLIVGPDRKSQFEKMFLTFRKENKYIVDPSEKNFGKGEMLGMIDRGDVNTSATEVRNSLKENNKAQFINLTGYSSEMYKYLKSLVM